MALRSCAMLRSRPPLPAETAVHAPPPAQWAPFEAAGREGTSAADEDVDMDGGALAPLTLRVMLRNVYVHFRDTALDVYAAFVAFASQLITAETLGVAGVAVASVFAFCSGFAAPAGAPGRPRRVAANLNWTIFATVVVFPLCVHAA